MILYRHFINTDPPLIVSVWNRQKALDGQISELTALMCEKHLFSKPYFDPAGLILAFRQLDDRVEIAGFVHAGFSKECLWLRHRLFTRRHRGSQNTRWAGVVRSCIRAGAKSLRILDQQRR